MKCKDSIRDLGKERRNEMGEGLNSEMFFSSCVGRSETFCFSAIGGRGQNVLER